jgi:hypothetical protein
VPVVGVLTTAVPVMGRVVRLLITPFMGSYWTKTSPNPIDVIVAAAAWAFTSAVIHMSSPFHGTIMSLSDTPSIENEPTAGVAGVAVSWIPVMVPSVKVPNPLSGPPVVDQLLIESDHTWLT